MIAEPRPSAVAFSPEVEAALAAHSPVVALESTLLAHGLPRPDNRSAADEVEAAVRRRRGAGDHRRPGRRAERRVDKPGS